MRIDLIVLLCWLLSCKSTAQSSTTEVETCKKDIVIVESEVISQLESFFSKEDFYQEDSSQYYMYEIVLYPDLKVKSINTVFKNNQKYAEQLKDILKELSFEKIDVKKSCDEYILPFIVQARLKKLIYPKDKTFYEVNLPIE